MTIARPLDIILAHGPELSAGGLDYYKLGLWAGGQPNSRILSLNPALPPEELERRLRAFLHADRPHTVLVAALDPHHRARRILRLLTEVMGVNPELISVVDLQEALGSPDPEACSITAHHLIGVNASMVTRAQPITTQEVPVNSRILVWGDSFAALKAAMTLEPASRLALLRMLHNLMLNINQQVQFIDYMIDLSISNHKNMVEMLKEPPLGDLCRQTSVNGPQKARAILNCLRSIRFPALSQVEKGFKASVSRLNLPKGVRIAPPPYFEGPELKMEILFRHGRELKEKVDHLARIEELKTIGPPWERGGDD